MTTREQPEKQERAAEQRIVFGLEQRVEHAVERGEGGSECKRDAHALQDPDQIRGDQADAGEGGGGVGGGEVDVLRERGQQQEEHGEREADERVLHRVDGEPAQQLEQEERAECQAEEEEPVLRGALELLVDADRLDEPDRDPRVTHALRGEARDLPAGGEAVGADLVSGRQEASLERGMRPVGAHRDRGVGAERRERERLGAAELEVDRERDFLRLGEIEVLESAVQALAGAR